MKSDNDNKIILLDEQDNKQNKNIINVEEKVPLKKIIDINEEKMEEKKKLQSILIKIADELNKGDDNDEDKDKKQNKYPIKIGQVTIIKTKLQIFWAQNYNDDRGIRCRVKLLFYIFLPFLTSINLMGIFQIISVMNALFKAFISSVWCYFDWEDKEDKSYYNFYNFYSFYSKESINERIEFGLIETMSFFGIIVYEFYGYKASSILFMITNCISIFLIYFFLVNIMIHLKNILFYKYYIYLFVMFCYLLV